MKTSNPALNVNSFRVDQAVSGEGMTLTGTVNKTGVLLICVVATAALDHSAFRSSIARPTDTFVYASSDTSRMPPARLKARMDSLLSFPIWLFHPLQHAGLPGALRLADNPLGIIRVDWRMAVTLLAWRGYIKAG